MTQEETEKELENWKAQFFSEEKHKQHWLESSRHWREFSMKVSIAFFLSIVFGSIVMLYMSTSSNEHIDSEIHYQIDNLCKIRNEQIENQKDD